MSGREGAIGLGKPSYELATKLVGGREEVDPLTGALGVPIVMASTFHQADVEKPGQFDYARSGNPTRQAAEMQLAEIVGGGFGFCFASGMAAISSVLSLLCQGDHVVAGKDIYGGTYRALTGVFSKFGIDSTFVDTSSPESVEDAFRTNTRMVFIETPSNPLLTIADIKSIAAMAKSRGALLAVDNTFMTPLLQRPLDLGADISIHSATKFLGGHSDLVAGCVLVRDADLAQKIYYLQNAMGGILGPNDSWLLIRGLKTLKVRLETEQEGAKEIASRLASRSDLAAVYYPGLASHPGAEIHAAQAQGPGAVLSFDAGSGEAARAVLKTVKIPAVAVSLGGVESILSYPWAMSHAAMPEERRTALGITSGLLRLSVGLEDVEDLWRDLASALDSALG